MKNSGRGEEIEQVRHECFRDRADRLRKCLVHRVTLALTTIWLAPLPPLLSPFSPLKRP